MCVEILLYSAISFISKLNDHVIAANCPYTEIPGIVLNEEIHSQERDVKKKYLNFDIPIRVWASLHFNHTHNNIQRRNQTYIIIYIYIYNQ